jgi:hypothetical protein
MAAVGVEEVGERGGSYVVGGVGETGVIDIVAATMRMYVRVESKNGRKLTRRW